MTVFSKIAFTTCASLAVAFPLRADAVLHYQAGLQATQFGGTGAGRLRYAADTDPQVGPVAFNLRLRDVPANSVLVLANNELMGPVDLTDGSGQLTLVAAQGDHVPTLESGSGIVITDADTGDALLIGVLGDAVLLYRVELVATPFGGTGTGGLRYAVDTDPQVGPVAFNLRLRDVPANSVWVLANNELMGPVDLTDGSGQLTLVAAQGDHVPTLKSGSGIVITDADTGEALLIGVLENG